MTPTEQRIAVAEWMGLVPKGTKWVSSDCTTDDIGNIYYITGSEFHNDLNAMHEAEKKLTNDGSYHSTYCSNLCDICRKDGDEPDSIDDLLTAISATAPQRLEALCRTLWPERWEKGKP